MNCLSVRAPWAHLIIFGDPDGDHKDIENRTRSTSHRGPLAIHVSRRVDWDAMRPLGLDHETYTAFLGCIIGVVDLYACNRRSTSRWAERDSVHWYLKRPRALTKPIMHRGMVQIHPVSDDIVVPLIALRDEDAMLCKTMETAGRRLS